MRTSGIIESFDRIVYAHDYDPIKMGVCLIYFSLVIQYLHWFNFKSYIYMRIEYIASVLIGLPMEFEIELTKKSKF